VVKGNPDNPPPRHRGRGESPENSLGRFEIRLF
jgi:hypothetical protein